MDSDNRGASAVAVEKNGAAVPWKTRVRRKVDLMMRQVIGRPLNGLTGLPYQLCRKPEFHWSRKAVPRFPALYEAWTRDNEENAWDMTRFYSLYENAIQILNENIRGDIVELGVYRGNSAAILAQLAREKSRRLYLFDTFTGFDSRDFTGLDAHRRPGFEDVSMERVKRLVGTEGVFYVPGFFPESCEQIELPDEIAIAHLDCDLYEPTKAGLERFYPRVAAGGLIVVHDYSSGCWPGVTRAVDEFFAMLPERPVLLPDRSGSVAIRKAFQKQEAA